jgi:uncharacterized protein YciI
MQFDHYTLDLLLERADAPHLDDNETAAIRDGHLAHLAALHDAGHLLAAGPLSAEGFFGLSVFRVGPEEARTLSEADPAFRAGWFTVTILPWAVPAGAMSFTPVPFPHSTAEARGD